MELLGSVLNVVDFGAFVDIGLHDSGLVHISHLSNQYVRDPHDVVSVGQVVRVWVLEIDKGRRRVALTMIAPGTPRQQERPPRQGGRRQGQQEGQAEGAGQQGRRSRRPDDRPPRVAAAGGPANGVPANGASGPPSAPRAERQQGGAGRRGRPPQREQGPRVFTATAKKVTKPLTTKMKEGKEPLRTFGDLKQFFTTREDSPADGSDGQSKAEG